MYRFEEPKYELSPIASAFKWLAIHDTIEQARLRQFQLGAFPTRDEEEQQDETELRKRPTSE